MSVIVSNGVQQLANALAAEQEDHIQSAICWTIGQVGRHTPEHAKAIAQANLLLKLLRCYMRTDASDDLQSKVRMRTVYARARQGQFARGVFVRLTLCENSELHFIVSPSHLRAGQEGAQERAAALRAARGARAAAARGAAQHPQIRDRTVLEDTAA